MSSDSSDSAVSGETPVTLPEVEAEVVEVAEPEVEPSRGALRSPPDERDWRAEAIYPAVRELALPKSLDLRPNLPPVRDQGSQSTCVAQSATAMKEWQERVQVDLQEPLSPQFVYNLRENAPAEGMYGRDVMRILSQIGICREATFEYGTLSPPPPQANEEATNFRIKSYALVSTVDAVKTALNVNGPCIVLFPCYNSSTTFWRPDGSICSMGHAVTIVGYNSTGFILRNSWGAGWGDRGHTIYPYSDFGSHWEIWTTIDDASRSLEPLPRKKGCCVVL